jgi:hypothetical protein
MDHDLCKLMQTFEREGLKSQAKRYLEKHPERIKHLTLNELREQIVFHPFAPPNPKAKMTDTTN